MSEILSGQFKGCYCIKECRIIFDWAKSWQSVTATSSADKVDSLRILSFNINLNVCKYTWHHEHFLKEPFSHDGWQVTETAYGNQWTFNLGLLSHLFLPTYCYYARIARKYGKNLVVWFCHEDCQLERLEWQWALVECYQPGPGVLSSNVQSKYQNVNLLLFSGSSTPRISLGVCWSVTKKFPSSKLGRPGLRAP